MHPAAVALLLRLAGAMVFGPKRTVRSDTFRFSNPVSALEKRVPLRLRTVIGLFEMPFAIATAPNKAPEPTPGLSRLVLWYE